MSKYKKFYKEIWQNRKQMDSDGAEYVECVDCGVRIYESQLTTWNFSHDRSKGARPDLKYDPSNISIRCKKCHMYYDHKLTLKT